MKDKNGSEDWRTLCELASQESDPQKLMDLIERINQALEESRPSQPDQATIAIDMVLLPGNRAPETELDFYGFPSQPSLELEYDW